MCGITDLPGLMACICQRPTKFRGYIFTDDLIFMYVKNYCHYSKSACQKLLNNNMRNVKIVDVINRAWTAPINISIPTCTHVPQIILNDIKTRYPSHNHFSMETVPQIFVYKGNQWRYIGGCDDFLRVSIYKQPVRKLRNQPEKKAKATFVQTDTGTPAVALKL